MTGRGRGYTGRRHLSEDARPGDEPVLEPIDPLKAPDLNIDPNKSEHDVTPIKIKDPNFKSKGDGNFKAGEHNASSDPVQDANSRNDVIHDEDEKVLKELLFVDEKFKPILVLLEQFNHGEDGILFNQKLRHFEATLNSLCPDENMLPEAFAGLRAGALVSGSLARKLATVGAAFSRQQRSNILRTALLNIMQATFTKLEVIERSAPQLLVNASNLMADYYTEARLANGAKVQILAPPLLQYMRSLLASNDMRAHRSLATQLMTNGRDLLLTQAQELEELSISIRIRLLSAPPSSIVWLLLSSDVCLTKFLPLPNYLQQFYASYLDLTNDDQSYQEVSYGSWKKGDKETDFSDLDNVSTDNIQNISRLNLSIDENGEPRKLRPILGAGAGLKSSSFADSVANDGFETWSGKTTLAKRYDLNSWRQNEQNEFDGQNNVENNFSAQNETSFTAQFPSEQSFQQFSAQNAQDFVPGQPFVVQSEQNFVGNQQFVDIPENFTQPPPFVPKQHFSSKPLNIPQNSAYIPTDFSSPPPMHNQYQNYQTYPQNVTYPINTPPSPQNANIPFSSPPKPTLNPVTTTSFPQTTTPFTQTTTFPQKTPTPPFPNATRTPQSEKAPVPIERKNSAEKNKTQNFPNSERQKKPPENWRSKEKPEITDDFNRNRQKSWTRQKSKDSETENSEVSEKDSSRVGFRDGAGDSKSFRPNSRNTRESRPNNRQNRPKKEDSTSDTEKPRRNISDIPKSRPYWGHDDRCDKDYNS